MKKRFIFIAVLALLFVFPTTSAQAEIPQDDLMSLVGNVFLGTSPGFRYYRRPIFNEAVSYVKLTTFEQAYEFIYDWKTTPHFLNMVDVQEIIARHDEHFFEENFLLVLDMVMCSSSQNFSTQVVAVADESDFTRIHVKHYTSLGPITVVDTMFAEMVHELDRIFLSRDIEFVIVYSWMCRFECLRLHEKCQGFWGERCRQWHGTHTISASKFHPPLTGVPGITATMAAMFGFMVASAVLWGVLLHRRTRQCNV